MGLKDLPPEWQYYIFRKITEERKGNKKLKEWGCSTRKYSEFKRKFYELAKLPKEGG